MARKKKLQPVSIDEFLRDNLGATLRNELGCKNIAKLEMPEYFRTALNPAKPLRPYQTEAFQYFRAYWENEFEGKPAQPQLLFHMATGSGKTLIMAGLILYLYEQGYRNFLFFVNNGNVIEKTKDNFFNPASAKYLFRPAINIAGKRVEVKHVSNFQDSDPDAVNFCLQTIQGLHSDLNDPKENGVTYEDFRNMRVALIADEAHHINGATKRGEGADMFAAAKIDIETESDDWETTVMRIFRANPGNVLLEFTATEDFTNPEIADKYRDKVLFDYPLRRFREDGYSKEIAVVQSDLPPVERALRAVIMSQFRRKLGTLIRLDLKPVVMFKSKSIKDNKAFFTLFSDSVRRLDTDTLRRIRDNATDALRDAFDYFEKSGVTLENLLLEIKEDFKEDNLLLVDGSSISAQKQQYLNSLESRDNEFRAVFAVNMLNEGWDVLNLFDIVRMYDTRDAHNGVPGTTTNSEAQLIGRGARYFPFTLTLDEGGAESADESVFKRKFDSQLDNPLRHLETLSYHSASNPRYIQELHSALAATGIIESESIEVEERLKESFKKSRLYTSGYVFTNAPEIRASAKNTDNLGTEILGAEFTVKLATGETSTEMILADNTAGKTLSLHKRIYRLGDFGRHILRAAVNRTEGLTFSSLHKLFPGLESMEQFIENPDYLANIRVCVYGREETVSDLSRKEQLHIAVNVLSQIMPRLSHSTATTIGSRIFTPRPVREVFHDHRFKVPVGKESKEEGISMRETTNPLLRLDLRECDWYAYDDNFGTEEEKFLIKYIESIIPRLREKYSEIHLLRNYKDLKIYSFDDGRATEPDFLLFLRKPGQDTLFENLQLFIEPKGEHLRRADEWKALFLQRIHAEAEIHLLTGNDRFNLWGLPFYTHSREQEFDDALTSNCL